MIEKFGRHWWKLGGVFVALWGGLHLLFRSRPLVKPIAISHRGAAGSAAENTLESIRRAIELGATHIEVDVQRTADNVLVLLHDRTINRTTRGKGTLRSLVEVFWPVPFIDPTFVWRQRRNGRKVWIWTVDNRWLMRLLLWLGVDGITTNCPERWPM